MKSLFRGKIAGLEQRHADAMRKHETDCVEKPRKQEELYLKELRAMREEHKQELSKQKEDYRDELCAKEEEHDEELSKQKKEHEIKLDEQKDDHEDKLRKQEAKHAKAALKLKAELTVAKNINSTQAEELESEKSKNRELSLALTISENQNKKLEKVLFGAQPTTVSIIEKGNIIALLNNEIKYHIVAILNLQPKYRPVDRYVRNRIKRTEKAHDTIRSALDEGSLGALRQQVDAMRSKYEPVIIGKVPRTPKPTMQDINLLLQCLEKATNMVVQEKKNILERLESVGEKYVEQHRESTRRLFAIAEECGVVEELEWVQKKE